MANDQSDMPSDTRAITVRAGVKPLALVPATMEEAYRIATAVVRGGMAPNQMTAEGCLVAIMHGLEVGLTPMSALQKIAVVNGRPTIWGDGAIGLVRASGLLESIIEETVGEGDKREAVCVAKRKGDPNPIRRTFSVDDAKVAGLWTKTGPWKQYPARMLQMRARAFCLRDGFADVLGGLYLREEIEDEPRDVTPADQQPSQPAKPAGPPRGVQQAAQVIEHQPAVTLDVAHGAADVEKPIEVKAGETLTIDAVHDGEKTTVEKVTVSGPPRGVSTAPAADPKKAYNWPEIEARFRNAAKMAIDLGNMEGLEAAHANLIDAYEFTSDELDMLNKLYDNAEALLN